MDASELFGETIYSYSRAQALEDGELVDVSSVAREAGIKFPLAVTRGVWATCVELPDGYQGCQDERGRLWDVVWMLACAIRSIRGRGGDVVRFFLHVRRITDRGRDDQRAPRRVDLWAKCHGGDDGEPVITVMLPDED